MDDSRGDRAVAVLPSTEQAVAASVARRLQVLASLVVGEYDEPALHDTLVTRLHRRG